MRQKLVLGMFSLVLSTLLSGCLLAPQKSSHINSKITKEDTSNEGVLEAPTVQENVGTAQSESGWTELTAGPDSRRIYVSSSSGNDGNDGLSELSPKKTIAAAMKLTRENYPDWILLKSGDTFYEAFTPRSGRSETERQVLTSYGEGARPQIRPGPGQSAINKNVNVGHIAVVGLHLEPNGRTTEIGGTGFRLIGGGQNVLVEDCYISGFAMGMVIQGYNGDHHTNVVIRRNVIVNSYNFAGRGHSSGIYSYGVDGLVIEENFFDHNGWHGGYEGSEPTIFNHNTYLNEVKNLYMRNNIFFRSSSIHNKMCSTNTGGARNINIEDNFYFDGEIGISIGGNNAEAYRFQDVSVRNNVFSEIGRSNMTGRGIAWGIDIQDNANAEYEDNLFLNFNHGNGNIAVFTLNGGTNTTIGIRRNIARNINKRFLSASPTTNWSSIEISNNDFQAPLNTTQPISLSNNLISSLEFFGNRYDWNQSQKFARMGSSYYNLSDWASVVGDNSTRTVVSYPAPNRSVESYFQSIGQPGSVDQIIARLKQQRKGHWFSELTATEINQYIKAGF